MKNISRALFVCVLGFSFGVGIGFAGILTRPPGLDPTPTVTTTATHSCWITTTYPRPTPTPPTPWSPMWGQCGGIAYSGPVICESGGHCQSLGPYYSQCQPDDPSTMTYPDPITVTVCS